MGTLKHPDFATLPVIVGGTAKAGAFYVTYSGHYLSHIAQNAYGSGSITHIMRINKSKYNIQKCIYRVSDKNCSSSKVLDENVITMQPNDWSCKAWLSLCNADRAGKDGLGGDLGVLYQVIWVPPVTGEEPWELEPIDDKPVVPVDPYTPIDIPGLRKKAADIVDKLPDLFKKGGSEDVPGGGGGGEPAQEEEVQKASFPWWLGALLGLGAISTVIWFAVKDRKKRGKKRKKAK
jgi:hypothetical protein